MADLSTAILSALRTLEFDWHELVDERLHKTHRFMGGVPEPVLMCWIEADLASFNSTIDELKRRGWARTFAGRCRQSESMRILKPDGRVMVYRSSRGLFMKQRRQRHKCKVRRAGGRRGQNEEYEAWCSVGTCKYYAITDKGLSQLDARRASWNETNDEEPRQRDSVVTLRADRSNAWQVPVELSGPAEPVYVLGKKKSSLSSAQYAAIRVLVDAGGEGANKDFLETEAGAGARRTLRSLQEQDPDFARVILFPGKTGGRYRIVNPTV